MSLRVTQSQIVGSAATSSASSEALHRDGRRKLWASLLRLWGQGQTEKESLKRGESPCWPITFHFAVSNFLVF